MGKTALIHPLIITNQFPPNFDGVGDYSYHLQSLLIREGVQVGVITSNNDSKTPLAANLFPIIHKWNFHGCMKLYKLVKQKNTNCLLIQYVPYAFNKSGFPLIFIFFIGLFRIQGVHIHTNFHEVSIRIKGESLISKIRAVLQRILAYLLCVFSDTIQTSNKYYASLLYPFKVAILPIPSNFEFVIPTPLSKLNESGNSLTISANANRCTPVLLNSIAILKQLVKHNIRLYIIGRAYPTDLVAINQLLSEYDLINETSFFVNDKAETIVQVLLESDIFIQLESVSPHGYGGVSSKSGTTAAAMHLGIPIISTCGDMTDQELFKQGENICLVPFNDPNIISEKIVELFKNKGYHTALSTNAKESYNSHFAWINTLNYHLNSVLKNNN